MDRVAKEKVVSDLTKKFDESNFFILTHNNGIIERKWLKNLKLSQLI